MLYARRATQNQKEASAMNSIKPIKLKPNMIFAEPTLTPDEFTKNLEQHLSFSWLLCRKNNKTALYQLNLVDFLEFHVRIIIMSDLQLKVVLGKSLEVEDSRLEYWWQLKEILQKYDQNMHTGVLEELGLPDIKQEYKMNEDEELSEEQEPMNESLVDQTLEEYFEDPDFETIIVKDEGLASSSHERPETNKKKQGNDRDVLEINKGNLSVAKKLKVVYPCEICHDIFRSTISLEQHLFYQHSETDCKNCQKSFSDLKKLRVHSNKCSAIKSLQLMCSYCGDGFQYEKTLEEHVVRRHEQEKKVPCGICGKFFADGKDMKNHLFRHKQLRPVKCTLCEKTYAKSDSLKLHMESTHANTQFQCPNCMKILANSQSLKLHLDNRRCRFNKSEKRNRGSARVFICFADNCGCKFQAKTKLRDHMKEKHDIYIPNIERFCVECQQEFESMNLYILHARVHLCIYACKVCGKSFRTEQILKEHTLRHGNEERPFGCNECELKFKTESNLSSHKASKHSKRLEFVCSICDNQYPFKYLMERHIRDTHKREATFKCRICSVGFIDLKGRMRHMLQLHGTDHAYSCECLQTFKLMKELRDHKLEMHGEQTKDRKRRLSEEDQLKVVATEWSSEDEEMDVQ